MKFENNHESMKTQVETFLIEETQALIYDNEQLDKWNNHVRDLGLTGQTKIVKGEKSPIPFMHMKATTVNMFSVLCPRKVAVEEYDITPIPVEILDLIALSKRDEYFKRIEIWYDDKNPDPLCVGILGDFIPRDAQGNWYHQNKQSSINACIEFLKSTGKEIPSDKKYAYYFNEGNKYLIGKWADVKHSFAELKKMARERFITEKSATLKKEIREKQRELDTLEEIAVEQFGA